MKYNIYVYRSSYGSSLLLQLHLNARECILLQCGYIKSWVYILCIIILNANFKNIWRPGAVVWTGCLTTEKVLVNSNWRFILKISCHLHVGFQSGFSPWSLPTKILYNILISFMHAAHSDLFILISISLL
jgi:hypothetical protein